MSTNFVRHVKIRNLGSADLEKTVWRYMPFAKFISLMTYQALWFSKLNILQDTYEAAANLGKWDRAALELGSP